MGDIHFRMKLKVLHHDHCFDGLASAAVFSRFFLEKIDPGSLISYAGLTHKPNQKAIDEELFDGDQNVIVDFKFSPSPKLTWWFDHHQSAFLSPKDEVVYFSQKSPTKFCNPDYRSCTKFISDTVYGKYGFEAPDLMELIDWADIIDGALYETAEAAVELKAPALGLMLVIEASRNPGLTEKIICDMQSKSMERIMADPVIDNEFRPLYQRHLETVGLIKAAADAKMGVVFFDVSGHDVEGYSKFIPYYLFPECVYSVGVSLSPGRAKVSVGFNPWSPTPRRHNLASICERYNGGGHPVVGAISYPPAHLDTARATALEIVEELRR